MVATFITDICTAIALSVLFTKFNIYTLFYVAILAVLVMAYYKSDLFFENPLFKNKIGVTGNKICFFITLGFIFFEVPGGQPYYLHLYWE